MNPGYFDELYRNNDDPWNFETSEYESEKYEAALQALPRERYTNAFEIGCSIGVFTARLALRCARLVSIDIAVQAVERARRRCHLLSHVSFEAMSVPAQYPTGPFDLTVVSEIGYYLTPEDLAKLCDRITGRARRSLVVSSLARTSTELSTARR